MSKKSKTMEEIVLGLNITQNPGSVNKPLEIEKCNLARALKLIVDYEYQRLISPLKLQNYGILDYNLLVPVVVSRRPISLGEALSGERVIDGQNKVAKFILSQENEGLTLAILDHDEDATYEDVLKKEALVFNRLNTWRNKLSTIDVLRSGVCFNDPESMVSGDAWVYIPYCDENIGVALYHYEDASCTTPFKMVSPDFGCPKNGCCHYSGASAGMDLDLDGDIDFGFSLAYSIQISSQTGSEFGLSFGDAFSQLFKSFM